MNNFIGLCKKVCGKVLTLKEKREAFIKDEFRDTSEQLIPIWVEGFDFTQGSILVKQNELFTYQKSVHDQAAIHEICEEDMKYFRFYMDIDCKEPGVKIGVHIITDYLTKFIQRTFNHNAEFITIQKNDNSQSYHIYGNFATTQTMMYHIVNDINFGDQEYEGLKCKDKYNGFIDKAVYGKNKSLWLCNSWKFDKNKAKNQDGSCGAPIIKTEFVIDEKQFPNTLLNNITDLRIIRENVGLCKNMYINFGDMSHGYKYGSGIKTDIENLLKVPIELRKTGNNYGQYVIPKKAYICPGNPDILHESNNGFVYTKENRATKIVSVMFRCLSKACDNHLVSLLDTDLTPKGLSDIVRTNPYNYLTNSEKTVLTPTQCNKYLDFTILPEHDGKIVFIKSPMGSGKTFALSKCFDKYKNIIYCSSWITFTRSIGE